HLKSETLADQSGKLGLIFERVEAGDNASGAVAKQENRQARFPRFHQCHKPFNIIDIFIETIDEISLTVRFSAATQIERVYGKSVARQLLGNPHIAATMCIEPVNDHSRAARFSFRVP
ncbi:MAG TPA: hypothetical protein VK779_03270, partial [Rhizomicrobium sp.]|nr:hypothetical protein [Rhizomicrobium sp.]